MLASEVEQIKYQLRRQFVPNYKNIDPAVQNQIDSLIQKMSKGATKKQYQKFSQLGLLQEAPLLRSQIWKVLLDIMNVNANTWPETRQKNYQLYKTLTAQFFTSYIDEEDLLDICENSLDKQLWEQIVLDTKRTHSGLNFFQAEVPTIKMYASKPTRHCDVLSRILYIWGKINPTVRYVQGMNQILAPLYYLELQSLDSQLWDRETEVFFMFCSIMSFVIDMHIKQMDDCGDGIMGRMISLNKFLKVADIQLWNKMEKQNIMPQYYSFRWLALLLAQQFGLYDTIKLWDYLLAFQGNRRFFFLYCLCLAILKLRRTVILQNDFITALPIIQKLKDMDVEQVIKLGLKLYEKYCKVNIETIYQKILEEEEKMKKGRSNIEELQKSKKWTYGELLKSTTNYVSSKLSIWKKKQ